MTIKSRLNKVESFIEELENRGIFQGGTGCFITKDGKKVEVDKDDFHEIYKDIARSAWEGKEPQHELINEIQKAEDGIGLYFKCLVGEE